MACTPIKHSEKQEEQVWNEGKIDKRALPAEIERSPLIYQQKRAGATHCVGDGRGEH